MLRLRLIADHPLTPFILTLYIALDLVCIGSQYGWQATHVSRFLYESTLGRPRWGANVLWAIVTKSDDQSLVLVYQDDEEWQSRPELHDQPHYVNSISVLPDPQRDCGIYAPTYSRLELRAAFFEPVTLTPTQQSQFREQVLDHWVAKRVVPTDLSSDERRRFIAGQPVIRITHHPLGYLHNTLSLLMFALLCWSLRLNIPKLWQRRPDPTKCPQCRYSTIGLTTNTCPECGNCISTSD